MTALRFLALVALMMAPVSLARAAPDAYRTVLIIRHAEPDDSRGISDEGQARAEAYAKFLRNATLDGRPLTVGYLFAAGDTDKSQRPGLTLGPTAAALGLKIDDAFKTKQVEGLSRALDALPAGAVALVAWRHGHIPELLESLGADPASLLPDGKWPGKVYDWLLVLQFDADGKLLRSRRVSLGQPQ